MKQQENNTKTSFYNDPTIKLVDPAAWDEQKSFVNELAGFIKQALSELDIDARKTGKIGRIGVEKTQEAGFGDFSSNVAMQLAKSLGRNPRELAQEIISKLQENTEFLDFTEKIEVAGPGFINFFLKKEVFINELAKSSEEKRQDIQILRGKKIVFEYAHPNPFKSFHIGHLRNIVLGESLIRILESLGAEVMRVNYQGDVGMHIAKSLWAMLEKSKSGGFDIEEVEKLTSYEKMRLIGQLYAYGATKYEEDETLQKEIRDLNYAIYTIHQEKLLSKDKNWQPFKKYSDYMENPDLDMDLVEKMYGLGKQWSLQEFKRIYERLYSTFAREYMESETLYHSDLSIKKALEQGTLKESEGAVIFSGKDHGLDTRVFLNSFKLPTYEGKELGLGELKYDEFGEVDLHIHNVAVEQISFFKVTFKVKELLDPAKYKGKQYHNAYEFVGLTSGKMASRKGKVVLAEDVLNEAKGLLEPMMAQKNVNRTEQAETLERITVGAVKYAFLNISPFKYLAFDIKSSVNFEGDSGPYLLYTYARGNKLVQDSKAEIVFDAEVLAKLETEHELKLLKQLSDFRNTVIESGKQLAPNYLTTYLFELAQLFNSFYKNSPVLSEPDAEVRQARLVLTKLTTEVLEKGLYLLGIKTVERM